MITVESRNKLKKVLQHPRAKGLKEPYYLIEEEKQAIYIVSPGQNGPEFNKTLGFFNKFPAVMIYQCLYGQGVLIMQRNDEQEEAKEFKVVSLTAGRQVEIPALWGLCLVNVGRSFLVVLETGTSDPKYKDTKPIIEKRGLAYYIVEKKGEISFEPNSNYILHPQITTE